MSQIVKYRWENWEPAFFLSDGSKMPLFGQRLSMTVGEKKCIGYVKNGKRFKCPHENKTVYENVCDGCKKMDDYYFCMCCSGECLNPRKRGQCLKGRYVVYMAAFDSLLKIGISVEHRLMERLVEQGADFGTNLMTITDGKAVRKIEQKIRSSLEITDRICGKTKSSVIFGDPNSSVHALNEKIKLLKVSFPDIDSEIFDLRKFYRLENVTETPVFIEPPGNSFEGEVVAAKGNIIIINNGSWQMANAHRFIGRDVTIK